MSETPTLRRPWTGPSWGAVAMAGLLLTAAAWLVLSAAGLGPVGMQVLLYSLSSLVVFTDAIDFGLRLYMHRWHTAAATSLGRDERARLSIDLPAPQEGEEESDATPYAIIASIHNLEERLDDFMDRFTPWREHFWLISDGSTDNTVQRLRSEGWRCVAEEVNRKKPGALRHLLALLPARIRVVMVIDPDVRICGRDEGSSVGVERVVADLLKSGAAAASPRVAIEHDGLLGRFQALEYALGFFVGRRSMADFGVTSGAAFYRRDALAWALARHSLSVYAEDLEIAVALLRRGERIYYDGRLVLRTEGPETLRRWFSQRVGWYYGLARVYTTRFHDLWRISRRTPFAMYNFIAYMGGVGLLLHVPRLLCTLLLASSCSSIFDGLFALHWMPHWQVINPVYFMAAVASYFLLGMVALFAVVPREERAYMAPIVPVYFLYVLLHVAPVTVGFLNWITVRLWNRRVFRDHYQAHEEPGLATR